MVSDLDVKPSQEASRRRVLHFLKQNAGEESDSEGDSESEEYDLHSDVHDFIIRKIYSYLKHSPDSVSRRNVREHIRDEVIKEFGDEDEVMKTTLNFPKHTLP